MVTDATLVTRPTRDTVGAYAYGEVWMRSVLNSLAWRGGTRKQLLGDDAVSGKFGDAVASLNPSLYVGMGHGDVDIFVGQYINGAYSVLLTTANAGLMAGRVVYLLSCLTAQQLGPALIQNGAVAYAGYNQEFGWVYDNLASPATDRYAAPFGRASTVFPRVLIGGKIVSEAKERAINQFNKEIEAWEKSTDTNAGWVVGALLKDRDAFTVLGNEGARGLDPKLAVGIILIASAAGAGVLAYLMHRRKRKR